MKKANKILKLINLIKMYIFNDYYKVNKLRCLRKIKKMSMSLLIPQEFIDKLGEIEKSVYCDYKMYLLNDPALKDEREVIFAYPGFDATLSYRVAHLLSGLNVNLLPRIISENAHSKTGIDIHPDAIIKDGLFIDHGTGIVIGATSVIGRNVRIYHGVTLGAINLDNPQELTETKRHPTIEDGVTLYSNCTILGGDTVIGKNSIIGANVLIIKSVEESSKVFGKNIFN